MIGKLEVYLLCVFLTDNLEILKQACQIGGPIPCSMMPVMTFFIPYMIEDCSKLFEYTVISSIKHL